MFQAISTSPQKTQLLDTTFSSPSSAAHAFTSHHPNYLSYNEGEAIRARSFRASSATNSNRSLKNIRLSPENHQLRIDVHDFEIENALQEAQEVRIGCQLTGGALVSKIAFFLKYFEGVRVLWNESESPASADVGFKGIENLQCCLGGQCWSRCRFDFEYTPNV
jgi:hypothetical protein